MWRTRYAEGFYYWEAVDLTRKLLLTSAILLVAPDSLWQLWFASTIGLVSIVFYLGLAPYRDQVGTS